MSVRHYLLTTLLMLAGWLGAGAQTVIHIQGQVTDANGTGQEGVEIWVTGFSAADSAVYFTTTFTGSDGTYETSLTFAGQHESGIVEVSMVDCFGNIESQLFVVAVGAYEIEADFQYCAGIMVDSCLVFIIQEGDPVTGIQLTAWIPPGMDAEFLWSTGDSSQTIVPQESGEYCVTASFPWGCDTTVCTQVDLDTFGFCFAFITMTANGDSTYNLQAEGLGAPPFMYQWSTGAHTPELFHVPAGTYCVTVTDVTGCEYATCIFVGVNPFCEAYIVEEPNGGISVIAIGEEPFTYFWNTGETTQTIFPHAPGLYCVTVTDPTGCTTSTCIDTGHGIDSCYVYINAFIHDTNTLVLEALASSGAFHFSYLWSTGDTTAQIFPQDLSENYCVTVTDSDGCEASACFDPQHYCYAWADVHYVDTNHAVVSVYTDPIFQWPGAGPTTYLWNTGDTTATIDVSASGQYCVTVSLGVGCTVESCAWVDFENLGTHCDAWIIQYPDSTGQWVAEAQVWGFGTFDYQWSTGDSTSVISLNPGEFACVTITSSFGCETVACTDTFHLPCQPLISITHIDPHTVELWAFAWGDPAQQGSYVWSTGDTTALITVSEEGTYCVTVSAAGCVAEACVKVYFNVPDSCGVEIIATPDPLGTLYHAVAWGEPPFTYLWSNGVTEPSFVVDFGPLDYCLTVTDANGCVATACYPPSDTCYLNLFYAYHQGSIIYSVPSTPLHSMSWSTGDTTAWIHVDEPGTYCATMYTAWGCTATTCITIDSIFPGIQNVISGYVFGDTLTALTGNVYAYRLEDNTVDEYVLLDSAAIDAHGFYSLSNLPNGLYLLKAQMDAGTSAADKFVPTYHMASATWTEANPHVLPNWLPVTTDIHLIKTTGLIGSGVIGGALVDPGQILAEEGGDQRGSDALAGIVILLKDAQGLPLSYQFSGEDGTFRFTDLPYGTYRLSYDLPGFHSPEIWVTLSPESPEKLGITLPISGTVSVDEPEVTTLMLYPNPARHSLYLPIGDSAGDCQVQMTDLQGRTVYTGSLSPEAGIIRLDVSGYAPGWYQVRVITDDQYYIGRWIRQD